MKTEYAPLDIASHLDNEEVIAEYLTAASENENPDVLLLALANVAKARGIAHIAKAAGLGRESLYKALAPGAHPRFATIQAILRALNVSIVVKPPTPAETKPATKKAEGENPTLAKAARVKALAAYRKRQAKKAAAAAKPPAPARKHG